jgi:hypothetical protein
VALESFTQVLSAADVAGIALISEGDITHDLVDSVFSCRTRHYSHIFNLDVVEQCGYVHNLSVVFAAIVDEFFAIGPDVIENPGGH